MGRIVSNFFISLDGVVESPDKWHFGYFDEAMGAIMGAGMAEYTGFLMGRRLYDEWSSYWPGKGPEEPFAEFINAIPKYVLSSTLTDPSWQNTTVIGSAAGEDVAARVQRVKDDGAVIGMSGSATTARWLLAHGLLDEFNLLVHPVAVGSGQRLFEDPTTYKFDLVASQTLGTGVMHVRYAPAGTAAETGR